MYKHCDIDNEFVSLHDCHATKILFERDILTLVFDDGFWITKDHPSNKANKTVRTDKAEVQFRLKSDNENSIIIYVFDKKFSKTVRREWKLSDMLKCVNKENYTIEFLYQYKGYNSMIIECRLWSDKKPYDRECELKLLLKDISYCWNDLCEDREW